MSDRNGNEQDDITRIKRTLWGSHDQVGLTHEVKALTEALTEHLQECADRHKDAATKAEEKRAEDVRFYKGIIGTVVTAALLGLLGLLAIGIKVWATTPATP